MLNTKPEECRPIGSLYRAVAPARDLRARQIDVADHRQHLAARRRQPHTGVFRHPLAGRPHSRSKSAGRSTGRRAVDDARGRHRDGCGGVNDADAGAGNRAAVGAIRRPASPSICRYRCSGNRRCTAGLHTEARFRSKHRRSRRVASCLPATGGATLVHHRCRWRRHRNRTAFGCSAWPIFMRYAATDHDNPEYANKRLAHATLLKRRR